MSRGLVTVVLTFIGTLGTVTAYLTAAPVTGCVPVEGRESSIMYVRVVNLTPGIVVIVTVCLPSLGVRA
jgi:hypothetical protein